MGAPTMKSNMNITSIIKGIGAVPIDTRDNRPLYAVVVIYDLSTGTVIDESSRNTSIQHIRTAPEWSHRASSEVRDDLIGIADGRDRMDVRADGYGCETVTEKLS
ncbi:hypothetical protein C0995_009853 [Termitomyces sp. Mi166|nr:hypothetical protein C0995_009853 [Termitomyces sp. Mi166\